MTTRFLQTCTSLMILGFAVSGLWAEQETTTGKPADLFRLKSGFEAAMAQHEKKFVELDASYRQALDRLLKAETAAGNLEGAVAVRQEAESFAGGKKFNAEEFEERLSDFAPLNRLQTTYQSAREKFVRKMARPHAELARRYMLELQKLQQSLTRSGEIDAALEVQEEKNRMERNLESGYKIGSDIGFKGEAKLAAKGEVELFVNGDQLRYRNIYKGSEGNIRIVGESPPREFAVGDAIVIRGRSNAVFRGIVICLVATDETVYVPIKRKDLRVLGEEVDPRKVTAEMIAATRLTASRGSADSGMLSGWSALGLPASGQGGSEWFQPEAKNQWQVFGVVITPGMVTPLKESVEQ